MKSIENICEKFAFQNALDYGKAQVGPIMRIIMSVYPDLRNDASKVKEILEKKVEYVNSIQKAEIEQIIQQKFPELLKKEEVKSDSEDVDFIRTMINEDNRTKRFGGRVHTRFPPEPNGYLHIGHAKSINLNYGIAEEYSGKFNLRFDDTNPITEEAEYVKGIIEDVKWIGGNFEDRLLFASNYFDQFYNYAVQLVKKGLAYVDDLTVEEIRDYRGTLTEPGKESPFRNRTIEENLDLFERMKAGEFPNGSKVLRAKIDMNHPNLLMRDPIMYRILHENHHNTGDKWCIYPMYDFAHGLEDSIERVTHSICTMEFEVHRELYDWYLDNLEEEDGKPIFHSQQIEFARLNVSYTVLSKRKVLRLVNERYINGWDDPRLLTIVGLKRRGVTSDAVREFCKSIGVTKRETVIDISVLNKFIRDDLDKRCTRVMTILRPLKVILTNYPDDKIGEFIVPNHPKDETMGKRKVKFSKTLYIEQEDFMENPLDDFRRLSPGKEVRLKYSYFIKCDKVVKDKKTGEIKELQCSYDPATKGGTAPDGRDVQGTIHWLSATNAVHAEIRLYDQLFTKENPLDAEEGKDYTDYINPNSLEILQGFVEPHLQKSKIGDRYQFERNGYFNIDYDSKKDALVFNRIIPLRDSWSKK
ncbi:MAG TPA: glutamine--tRNA ligase/YqeY domain fusion protein [Candidatus Bathyarchaeia archaeon]|nr:glutamine--tRNA ligase/YqeY domain fusion protein [Candidatus Bathyarchaeia archaeon]